MKACIFDFVGVIVDSVEAHYLSWLKVAKDYQIKLDKDNYLKEMSGRKAYDNVGILLGERANDELKKKVVDKKTEVYLTLVDKYVKPLPGITPFLSELKRSTVPIALASSSRKKTILPILKRYSLLPYFNSVITAEDVKHAKPNPELFLTAALRLSINPEDCIVFEDSFSGVQAAHSAHMKVVLVTSSFKKIDMPEVDLTIKDFTQISVDELKVL